MLSPWASRAPAPPIGARRGAVGHAPLRKIALRPSHGPCVAAKHLLLLGVAGDHPRRCLVPAGATKDDLDAELEATQKTLDKVLLAVQAAQAAAQQQQQPPGGTTGGVPPEAALVAREQQLWDRQQAVLDRMQQQWDQERQAWAAREQQLLGELGQLRHELTQLLLVRAYAAGAAAGPAAAAEHQSSVVVSSPAPAPAAAGGGGSAGLPAAPTAASAASRPGPSVLPGQATVTGVMSSASAAVAAALRAVRDEGVTSAPTPAGSAASSSSDGGASSSSSSSSSLGSAGDSSDGASWQGLFAGSGERAVQNVAAAMAAVDTSDVLADLDLSFTSSRRRAAAGSNGSSGSGNGNGAAAAAGSSSVATASSSSGADSDAEGASSGSGAAAATAAQVEVSRGDPAGPPPVLTVGDDDIFWVSKLHDALMTHGFYPSDDEVENWLFAEGTQSALLTFQACSGLAETGMACPDTWRKLLGEEAYEAAYGHLEGSSSSSHASSSSSSSGSSSSSAVEAVESASGEVTYSFGGSSSSSSSVASSSSTSSSGGRKVGGWPVLMDMDGGKEVHALQVSLQKAGFYCGDDDMRWWQFGSSTMDALKTFQACSGLPESGVTDERTWLALLGPEAKPEDLQEVRGDESMYEDDMSAPHEGAVWLVGEQRWSRPVDVSD